MNLKVFAVRQPVKRFVVEYQHEGDSWIVEFPADSYEDAEQRVRAIAYGTVLGELHGRPVRSIWIARLICWIKNRGAV